MKKLLSVMLLCIVLFAACTTENPYERTVRKISNALSADVSAGTIQESADTHGGFLGDGEFRAVITFTKEAGDVFASQVIDDSYWHELPLSVNASRALYGEPGNCPLFTDENGDALAPEVKNGLWFFRDRHRQNPEPADDTGLFDRYSWNFDLALYDIETMTLYFFALDT